MTWKRRLQWDITRKLMVWFAKICPKGAAKDKALFAFLEVLNQEEVELGENPKPLPDEMVQMKRKIEF